MSLRGIETLYVDAQSWGNSRATFVIPYGEYAPGLRIANFGVYDDQLSGGDTGLYYPATCGADILVKKVSLKYGDKVFSQNNYCDSWATMRALNTSNQSSEDLNRYLKHAGWGFSLKGPARDGTLTNVGALTLAPVNKDYYSILPTPETQCAQDQFLISATDNATDGNPGPAGMLQLADLLEGLRNLRDQGINLPAGDLRLYIEFDTNPDSYFLDPDADPHGITPKPQVIRPVLILDKILGADTEADVNFKYLDLRIDNGVNINAPVAGKTIMNTAQSYAFQNKFVQDILLWNKSLDASGFMLQGISSPAQVDEAINLVVNGTKFLPLNGIDRPSQKMAYFNKVYGPLNVPMCAMMSSVQDVSNNWLAPDAAALAGRLSITAIPIGTTIKTLQIQYSRSYGTNVNQISSFTMRVYARVLCAFQKVKGEVTIYS